MAGPAGLILGFLAAALFTPASRAAGQSYGLECEALPSSTPGGLLSRIECFRQAVRNAPGLFVDKRCKDAGSASPALFHLYSRLAHSQAQSGDRREAAESVACILRQLRSRSGGRPQNLAPSDRSLYASCLYYRAALYRLLEEYSLSIGDFTEAVSLLPGDPGLYYGRGEAHLAKGDLAAAAADIRKSLELDPKNAKAFRLLGTVSSLKGDYDPAIENYTRALELDPGCGEAYLDRGIAYRYKGDYRKAVQDLKVALVRFPDLKAAGEMERALAAMRAEMRSGSGIRKSAAQEQEAPSQAGQPSRLGGAEALPSAPSRIPRAPLALLAAVGTLFAALFWALRSTAAKRARRLGNLIREKLQKSPDQAYALFQQYRRSGGTAAGFSPATLFAIFSPAHEEELVSELKACASPLHSLETAVIFSGKGRFQQALSLLEDWVLDHASRKDADCDKVVGILIRGLKAGEFVKEACRGRPPGFLTAYAAAFLRQGLPDKTLEVLDLKPRRDIQDNVLRIPALQALGRSDEALSLVNEKPRLEWTAEEYVAAFRLYLSLKLFDRLKETYVFIRGRCPIQNHPDLYYEYARRCEEAGNLKVAGEVYGRFSMEGFSYKDVAERAKCVKAALEEVERAGRAPAPRLQPAPPPEASQPASALPAAARIGGKYELRMPIGEGGMGLVYEAYDRALDRKVAIKKMRAGSGSGLRERQRFLQEARTIARVTHAYIVGIHDIVEEGGEIFLVLEYADGKPLSAVLEERGRLSLEECRAIFGYVCQAVDCAHRNQVLHRDMKPSNIMICREGYAKVMDFGLAREVQDTSSQTAQKEVFGTLAYMAPEQHLGEAHRSSDIFAMGATLYEMLTGELPFKGPDYLAEKERRKFAPPRSLAPDLSAGADAFMAAVLEPDPDKRVAGALEFLEGLKSF
ncbi:MAG: protein kinase [Elusimicrobia bacterium]|nr:protein kinase [Elusimicrobiota bacterium]